MTDDNAVPVLLVEDDADDIAITKRAFEKGKILNELFVVRDGEEALEFLRQNGRYCEPHLAPRPSLVLLDLKLPGKNGKEVLRAIKGDPHL
ncbi:MAG: response regulator, partial [Phycisphaerae bacterium]|nr:response regulator [Phycisphaerae bacterium]